MSYLKLLQMPHFLGHSGVHRSASVAGGTGPLTLLALEVEVTGIDLCTGPLCHWC